MQARRVATGPRRAWHWLVRDLRRSLLRFRRVPILSVPQLYARSLWLHIAEIAPRAATSRPERVVITLSTIPSRVRYLRGVLNSLIDQTEPADRIILALPLFSEREACAYPDVADLHLPPAVDVLSCADHGPATKLLPALRAEPDAALIVVDDDVIYPRDFISSLLDAHRRRPDAALGYRGVRLQPGLRFSDLDHVFASAVLSPTPVDVLFGTWGYLLPPGVLATVLPALEQVEPGVRWVDDVWISGHLARLRIPRVVVPARAFPVETPNSRRWALTEGPNRSGENDHRAIEIFAADW